MPKKPDDLSRLLEQWIIVRPDGTPILNGTPEDFEQVLRDFLYIERLLAVSDFMPNTGYKIEDATCTLIKPPRIPKEGLVDSFDL